LAVISSAAAMVSKLTVLPSTSPSVSVSI
jgi:hypothetical protein